MGEKTDRGIKDATKFLGNMFKKDDGAEAAANDGGNANAPAGSTPSAKPSASANKPATNLAHGFIDKQAHYREVPWSNLPLSARKANTAVGYDKASWDARSALPVDAKAWAKLPAFVKTACSRGKKKEGNLAGFTDREAHYEDVKWSKLNLAQRKAAKDLDYDKASWDKQTWCEIDDWHWWDLEDWHKKAVATLGWTEGAWEHYAHGSWGDMPDHARRAATTLGWTEEKWDNDWGWGDVCHKDWRKLSKEEQRCLHVLGYYKLTWGGYESGSESESESSSSESE